MASVPLHGRHVFLYGWPLPGPSTHQLHHDPKPPRHGPQRQGHARVKVKTADLQEVESDGNFSGRFSTLILLTDGWRHGALVQGRPALYLFLACMVDPLWRDNVLGC